MKNIILIVMVLNITLFAGKLTLMSEDYPPYNYPDSNGKAVGISVDIVNEIIKNTGDTSKITILPWARSYHNIQTKKNQVLFVMTRTKARENLFKWVGPVASNTWVLFAKNNFKDKISSLDELNNKKYIIGTYKDDACELFLKDKHFKNLSSVPDDELNVKKLLKGRIDLWIAGEYQGILKAKRINKSDNIKKVFTVKKTELYIAFSKDIDDKIINKWQKELDILKSNGKYNSILNSYLK